MVITDNSVRSINVALLDMDKKIKNIKLPEDDKTLDEAVAYVKKYLYQHLNDGSTYNINISGNANTADHALTADSATSATNANHATNADYATSADVAKGLPFGICDSLASDVAKTVTVSPAITTLSAGTTVAVKMTNTNNASNATLNVNGTGDYLIKRYSNTNAGTNGREAWQGGVIQLFTFDGTYWYLDDFRQNAQYALTAERAYGSGLCNTAADVADKIANLYNFTLQSGSTFTLYFNIANTAASALTLNMNSTGAKPIYINGVVSSATNYTIPKGTYLVEYSNNHYNILTDGIQQISGAPINDNAISLNETWSSNKIVNGLTQIHSLFFDYDFGNPDPDQDTRILDTATYTYDASGIINEVVPVGTMVHFYCRLELQSSVAMTGVYLNYGGHNAEIRCSCMGTKAMKSKHMLGGQLYDSAHPYRVWDSYQQFDLVWNGTYWMISGNPVVMSKYYSGNTPSTGATIGVNEGSYIVYANGYIEYGSSYQQSSAVQNLVLTIKLPIESPSAYKFGAHVDSLSNQAYYVFMTGFKSTSTVLTAQIYSGGSDRTRGGFITANYWAY